MKDYKELNNICSICKNYKNKNSCYVPPQFPKEKFNGIVIIGESPYKEFTKKSIFSEDVEILLNTILTDVGIEKNQCFITNAVKCYAENHKDTIKLCKSILLDELKYLELNYGYPKVIICLGSIASNLFLDVKSITKQNAETKNTIINNKNIPIIAIVHPAYILRQAGEDFLLYEGFVKAKRIINGKLNPKKDFEIITDLTEFQEAITNSNEIVLDIETTGLNPRQDKIISISFCDVNHPKTIYFALWQDVSDFLKFLKTPLNIIGHNIKFDAQFLFYNQIKNINIAGDTMLLHYILEQSSSSLKKIIWKLVPEFAGYDIYFVQDNEILKDDLEKLKLYNAYDVRVTYEIYTKMLPKLTNKQKVLYYDIYLPLILPISEMEYSGMRVDTAKLKDWIVKAQKELLELQTEYKIKTAGANINSVPQLREILKTLGLDKHIQKLTPKGEISTDEETLLQLQGEHEIIDLLLDYRKKAKIYSTYLKGLSDKLDRDRVYPQYWIGKYHGEEGSGGTITGRLSSSNPNAQNIPIMIRELFIPDNDDEILVQFDYSQIEIRVAGLLARDIEMVNYLKTHDFHRYVASKIFDKPYEEISDNERTISKSCTFGVLYGMSISTLANTYFGGKINKAEKFLEKYFKIFKKFKLWQTEQINTMKNTGKIENLFGLVRYLGKNEDCSRIAVNTPIQSVAGLICLWAIGKIHKYIKTNNLKAKIKTTVHDSIVLSMPYDEAEEHLDNIKTMIEDVYEILGKVYDWNKMPFLVEVDIAENWSMKKD